jgi:hypothetical protein
LSFIDTGDAIEIERKEMALKVEKLTKELEKSLQSKAIAMELELIEKRDMTAKYDLLAIELEESRRYVYICMYMCLYVYICMYILYICIYIYIYIYI